MKEALAGEGGHYFGLIRSRFDEELRAVEGLRVPAGWSFRPPEVGYDQPPVAPNLMQKRTAYEVVTRKRVGNWSSVGTGKTLSAILASRVANRRHTLIVTNKATIDGWRREILAAYPDSVVRTTAENVPGSPPTQGEHHYTILNYDRFQLPSRGELVRRLAQAGVDMVVFDEVQLVKQRDKNTSVRRKAVEGLVSLLSEHIGDDLHVLGMSATPVINNLLEARKLLEVVQGCSFADLNTQATAANALAVHRALMVYGFRYRAAYEMKTDLHKVRAERNDLLDELRRASTVLEVEQVLLPAKLDAVRDHIRPGVVIYTHYVDGMVEPIKRVVEQLGYRVGLYTGSDKSGLEDFLARRTDVLVGSKPVGTGLNGLQTVCDRIVAVSLPWTSAEWEQLEGRIRRQGSAFKNVSIVVPQVVLEHHGDEWSWDKRRWRAIEYKRTLSDCAVDGRIPEAARMSPERLLAKSREALEEWIKRIGGGEKLNLSELRPHLKVPLPPDVTRKLVVRRGDFTTLNSRWASSNSETLHARLKEEPEDWYLYHTLYRESRAGWPELPAEVIASDLRGRPDLRVGDFGCGECILAEALGEGYDVIGFDHVAVGEGVIACDMARTPLEDESLGAAVFSLSLMGRNWRDYLAEAHRTLQPFGLLFIAEPAKRWYEGKLERALEEAGFDLLRSRRRADFLYVRAVKS
ncbi:MAG: methyltransferase domain-containing protein [Actinomycetota bacterium]|nr:methyltransferase domain-containing protein [Actinomycetota bacterium]